MHSGMSSISLVACYTCIFPVHNTASNTLAFSRIADCVLSKNMLVWDLVSNVDTFLRSAALAWLEQIIEWGWKDETDV